MVTDRQLTLTADELEESRAAGRTCHLVGAKAGYCCERGCGEPPTVQILDQANVEHHRCGEHTEDATAIKPLRDGAAW